MRDNLSKSEKVCWDCLSESTFDYLKKNKFSIIDLKNKDKGCVITVCKKKETDIGCCVSDDNDCKYRFERLVLLGNGE